MEQISDLLINGLDAYEQWGVRMGDNFLSALRAGVPMKDYVTNSSALRHGVDYCDFTPKLNERDLTLQFTIEGDTQAEYEAHYDAFLDILYAGDVTIQVPSRSSKVYHLKYTGQQITYAEDIDGTFSKMSAKFKEPDPTFRTVTR